MSLRVKCIVLVSDFDARTPLGQSSAEFLVEADNVGIGRETVSFVAADTYQKAIQVAGIAHLMPSQPGVIQTLKQAPQDPAMDDRVRATGRLYSMIREAAQAIYEATMPGPPESPKKDKK